MLAFVSYMVDISLTCKFNLYKLSLFFGKLPYFKFCVRHELLCNVQFFLLVTTGVTRFPECLKHSGKSPKHSGKPSPSATLGEELPGKWFTGKRSSPSAKNRTLGEGFPECHGSTRGRFNTVGAVHFFFTLPRVLHSGKKFDFF
jgi:hypothetical protein